jgi:hypothetical protein
MEKRGARVRGISGIIPFSILNTLLTFGVSLELAFGFGSDQSR